LFALISDRGHRAWALYVAAEMGIGLYGLASNALMQRGATLYAAAHAVASDSPGILLLGRFAVSFVLIAAPTVLMGATFPLMVHLLRGRDGDLGQATGRTYAINTAGAASGALGLPLLLLPQLGVAGSLVP